MQQHVMVFICSTFADLSREREAVVDAVRRLRLQHDSMELFGARTGQPIETCLEEVRRSDILVIIVGHRYGTVVPERGISFSEAEYEEGRRLHKPCLVYIRDDNVPILPRLMETDPENLRRLTLWKDSLRNRHTVAAFAHGEDLAVQVAADLSRALSDLADVEAERAKDSKSGRSKLSDEITKLISEATAHGLDEDAALSIVRRSLAGAMNTIGKRGPTVFLSYSSIDRDIVRRFARGLEKYGVSVWFDEMQLKPGDEWIPQIERALDLADYVVFFISKNSMRQGYVQREMTLAFDRSRMAPIGRAYLLPVLLDKAAIPDMPPLLRDIQWLDATDGEISAAIDRLYHVISADQG